jgi:PTS system nitrogen regulatory IIA component
MAVGICKKAITDFQPIDDEPVSLIFMIAAAYNQHAYYLKTLSHFSVLLRSDGFKQSLLDSKTPEEAYAILLKG